MENETELYTDRAVGDWVVSGPIYPARGPGRSFLRAEHALKWAIIFYGEGRVRLLPESLNPKAKRWAILVKKV